MELNILNEVDKGLFEERFGIAAERKDQLNCIVADIMLIGMVNQMRTGDPVDVLSDYQKIAKQCSNIEEYTMAIHIYIFALARQGGKLLTEK